MVDVGERREMRKSSCFMHIVACTMRSWSILYHEDVSRLEELYNCFGEETMCEIRNPRGNRNITLNYYVIYLNIFIKHNIYRYFVYGCVCLRVRRYCGCAAVDRPQPQARVVEATIRRLFILLHDGAKGGRGTVYAAVWKQDVAGRSAAGENRWSPTFGCCAPMHRHISEFRGTYMV
ncbi:hypothetical protein QTP88_019010 [Uroleucon formosanum]